VNRPAVSGSHLDDPLRTRGIRFLVIAEQARHLSTRDPGQAGQLLERACRLFAQAGSVGEAAAAMGTLADIAYRRGNSEEVLRIRREVKLPVYPGSSAPARGPGLQSVPSPACRPVVSRPGASVHADLQADTANSVTSLLPGE